MGYYTKYELVEPADNLTLVDALREESGYSFLFDDSIKWYSHEEDIKAVMVRLGTVPTVLIEGHGEEEGDIWRKRFTLSNGKVTVKRISARITFPED